MANSTIEPMDIYIGWLSFMPLGKHTKFYPLVVSNTTPVATHLVLVGLSSLLLKAENSVQQPNKSNWI